MVAVLSLAYDRLSRHRLRFGPFGTKACDHGAWEGSQGTNDVTVTEHLNDQQMFGIHELYRPASAIQIE
jgi:hypothetical protein